MPRGEKAWEARSSTATVNVDFDLRLLKPQKRDDGGNGRAWGPYFGGAKPWAPNGVKSPLASQLGGAGRLLRLHRLPRRERSLRSKSESDEKATERSRGEKAIELEREREDSRSFHNDRNTPRPDGFLDGDGHLTRETLLHLQSTTEGFRYPG